MIIVLSGLSAIVLALLTLNLSIFKTYTYESSDPLSTLPSSHLDITKLIYNDQWISYEDDDYTSQIVLDVSEHQGDIDWVTVKESGITNVIIRCGYRGYESGNLYEDKTFKTNIDQALDLDFNVGVYFFSQAINTHEAIDEAYFVHDLIKDYQLQLPVVFDYEYIDYATSRVESITNAQITENALAFLSKIEELGHDPMIYGSISWFNDIYDLNQIMNYPLWIAHYNQYPEFIHEFSIWQYSDNASIKGIDEPVDLNLMLIPK